MVRVIPLIDSQNEEPKLNRLTLSRKLLFFLLLILLPFVATDGYGLKSGKLKGVYHRVKKGETLYSIARAYKVHVQDLAEVNNIDDSNRIEADRVIFIPDATEVVEDVMLLLRAKDSAPIRNQQGTGRAAISKIPAGEPSPSARGKSSGSESGVPPESSSQKIPDHPLEKAIEATPEPPKGELPATDQNSAPPRGSLAPPQAPAKTGAGSANNRDVPQIDVSGKVQFEKKRFIWPVKGKVISQFGIQPNGMYYNWISISAKDMTPVVAAASGTVIFSAELKDYGETIIIKHADNFATVYTHLKARKVSLDDTVKKGESIALVGKVGREDHAYMNFEIRHQNRARNPLFFLP